MGQSGYMAIDAIGRPDRHRDIRENSGYSFRARANIHHSHVLGTFRLFLGHLLTFLIIG